LLELHVGVHDYGRDYDGDDRGCDRVHVKSDRGYGHVHVKSDRDDYGLPELSALVLVLILVEVHLVLMPI